MDNSNLIYAYKKVSTNKIVYVGQTVNLQDRHKQHVKYDPYNKNNKEYEYPLSRGIREYGENAYELIIIENNLLQEELDDREKYWISYYDTYWHGYNQTIGGAAPTKLKFTEEDIDTVIEMLKDSSYSYNDIIAKTGVSMTHIYNINTGKRRKRDNIEYPIRKSNTKGTRGIIFDPEVNLEIHNLLKNTKTSMKKISEQFHCSKETIGNINSGAKQCYVIEGWTYPIRDTSMYAR